MHSQRHTTVSKRNMLNEANVREREEVTKVGHMLKDKKVEDIE